MRALVVVVWIGFSEIVCWFCASFRVAVCFVVIVFLCAFDCYCRTLSAMLSYVLLVILPVLQEL